MNTCTLCGCEIDEMIGVCMGCMSAPERLSLRIQLEQRTEKHGHIHLRVPMSRKSRYVRAARRMALGLSEWMTRTCDAASVETEGKQ